VVKCSIMSNYNKNPLDRILSATIEGLQSGDLSELNDAVEDSVTSVLNNVGDKLNKFGEVHTNGHPIPFSQHNEPYSQGSETRKRQEQLRAEQAKREAKKKEEAERRAEAERKRREANAALNNQQALALFNPVGSVSSVLYMVGGGVGMGVSALSILAGLGKVILGAALGSQVFVGGALLAVFGVLTNIGIIQKKRLDKAKRFVNLIGSQNYMGIEELANATNQSERSTASSLKRMLKKGFFPQGHIDEDRTTIMLSDDVYAEYLKGVKGRKALENSGNIIDTTAHEVGDDSELGQMIAEGNDYIKRLHALNEDIPGEIITKRLDRLETILKELFECVEKHPEQMNRMHEVMNYYLPTIMKLVEAYKEYDGISEADKEILEAKGQIEGSIDTINGALRKILNNLFRDSVWDVTTDAEVLNTMLTQKGLVSQFPKDNDN